MKVVVDQTVLFDRPADRHQHPLVSRAVVTVHFADVFAVSDLFGIS